MANRYPHFTQHAPTHSRAFWFTGSLAQFGDNARSANRFPKRYHRHC